MIDMLEQPKYIGIHSSLRLRKYNGQAHLAFSLYQNPDVIRLIDAYTLQRIKKMYDYLTQHGEVYFIEILIYERLYVREIYDYNTASKKMFELVGFYAIEKTEKGDRYALDLLLPLSAIQLS